MADSTGAPNTVPNMTKNGVEQELTPAQASTLYGSGNIKTATVSFTLNYKGLHVQFIKGVPVVCDTALLAALSATGAPVT